MKGFTAGLIQQGAKTCGHHFGFISGWNNYRDQALDPAGYRIGSHRWFYSPERAPRQQQIDPDTQTDESGDGGEHGLGILHSEAHPDPTADLRRYTRIWAMRE